MYPDPIFIDPHVHVLPPARLAGLMRWIKRGYPGHPVPTEISADDILTDLAGRGVTHFFNLVYPLKESETSWLNEFNLEFCRSTPGAVPFASLHPETPEKAAVAEAAVEAGFIGMKFHPFVQRFDPWDARMTPLYGFMAEARRPVIIHTGFEDFYRAPMPIAELEKILEAHPGLPMVFVHMCFPEIERAFELLDEFPELWLDATNVLACFRPRFKFYLDTVPAGDKLRDTLAAGIERHGARVMYGSDHPAGMGGLDEIYGDLEMDWLPENARRDMTTTAPREFVERYLPGFEWGPPLMADGVD